MMPRGFKPVGWVAAVGGAALGCYMLSLNVAAERAELMKIEQRILTARSDIRTLQTELGTRGRLQQLEHWNAEVLALSAPTANQFVQNEVMLARFETQEPTVADKAKVQMASAVTTAPAPVAAPRVKAHAGRKLSPAEYAAAAAATAAQPRPMLRMAAAQVAEQPKVLQAAAVTGDAARPEPKKQAVALAGADPAKATKVESEKKPAKLADAKAEPKKTAKAADAKSAASKSTRTAETKADSKKPTKTADAGTPKTPAKSKASGGAGGQ